jgi:hypothetical protein
MGKMMVWLDSTPVVLTRMITFGLTKPHFGGGDIHIHAAFESQSRGEIELPCYNQT